MCAGLRRLEYTWDAEVDASPCRRLDPTLQDYRWSSHHAFAGKPAHRCPALPSDRSDRTAVASYTNVHLDKHSSSTRVCALSHRRKALRLDLFGATGIEFCKYVRKQKIVELQESAAPAELLTNNFRIARDWSMRSCTNIHMLNGCRSHIAGDFRTQQNANIHQISTCKMDTCNTVTCKAGN